MNENRYKRKAVVSLAALSMFAAALFTGCADERLEDELSYRQLGINYMQSGDYEEAVVAFDSALSYCTGKITGTELDICYYKAAAQFAAGDTEGALETYDAMLDYNKKDADAYYLRGCLLLQMGDTEEALEDFASAVTYRDDDYELYISIYENLSAYNMQAEGEEYLNKAFSIKGSSAEQLASRGKLYFLLGQYENAIAELEAALDAGSVEANFTIAQVYEAQGDSVAAEAYYQTYVDAGAADSETFNAIAEIEMAKSDYQTALTYISQGLGMETVTNRQELMQNQIICLEYTGDFAGAWEVIQEYVTLYPEDTEAQREYIFLKNRQVTETESTAEE